MCYDFEFLVLQLTYVLYVTFDVNYLLILVV